MNRILFIKLAQFIFTAGCVTVCMVALVQFSISKSRAQMGTMVNSTTNAPNPSPSQPANSSIHRVDKPQELKKVQPETLPAIRPENPSPSIPTSGTADEIATLAKVSVPKTAYITTPVSPLNGDHQGYIFSIQQCIRAGQEIDCWGIITNTTDETGGMAFHETGGVDDQGNTFVDQPVGFKGAGWSTMLMPQVPTKMELAIRDAQRNVKTINLEVHTEWAPAHRIDDSLFIGVPVQ